MGTFHDDKGELHGITVVVETDGPEVFVGRFDEQNERGVILLDADGHQEGEEGRSNREWLQRAAEYGVWKKYDRLVIAREKVKKIYPLGEVGGERA
jgi:hypothetical protein